MLHVNDLEMKKAGFFRGCPWDSQFFNQPPEGAASLFPAAMDTGVFVDGVFVPAKMRERKKYKQLNYDDAVSGGRCILPCCSHEALDDLGKYGLYEITPALYNAMSPDGTETLNLESLTHFRQMLAISLTPRSDIRMLISLKQNLRLFWRYRCTFKRFKLCCGVT